MAESEMGRDERTTYTSKEVYFDGIEHWYNFSSS